MSATEVAGVTAAAAELERANRRRTGVLVLCAVLAFKGALSFQQIGTFGAMKAAGCPDASLQFGFGPGSPQATGLASCSPGETYVAGFVGLAVGLALAVPLLLLYASDRIPSRRTLAFFLYLLAVGALAEVLSGTVVFGLFGYAEAGELIDVGIPAWTIVAGGLAIGLAMARPVYLTAPLLGRLADRPEHHAEFLKKAVWFKLTVGVVILSAARFLFSA